MKKSLWMLLVLGGCWLFLLVTQAEVRPHVMLDAILPPRVLDSLTPEENAKIVAALKTACLPVGLSWLGACLVCGISACGLLASRKTGRMEDP